MKKVNVRIREYSKTDYKSLRELLYDIFTAQIAQDLLEEKYINDSHKILVAVNLDDNRVIGCAFLEKRNDYIIHEKSMFISYVATAKRFQRQGIGRLIFNQIFEIAISDNCAKIELTSADHRVSAHAFYQSIGFTRKSTTVFIKELADIL